MKTIPWEELYNRFLATRGGLAHLRTETSHRRQVWDKNNFHDIGDPFVRDLKALLLSKAERRMSGKNQVASSDLSPYIRNRATHVSEVEAHSISIAENLGLNIHLVQSISEGHDMGHVPFGHQGESYLRKRLCRNFTHEIMGVIVAQHIERGGEGLNLTHATLDGMFRHSGSNASPAMTPEAWVVRYADKIAYLFADYNDFRRMGWRCPPELVHLMDWFGDSHRNRSLRVTVALCEESVQQGHVTFEASEAAVKFRLLRELMNKQYVKVVQQDVSNFLDPLYTLLENSGEIPAWLGIALLTDAEVRYLISSGRMLSWSSVMQTGLGEIIDVMYEKEEFRQKMISLDPTGLDLDW
jgi:dGTPase